MRNVLNRVFEVWIHLDSISDRNEEVVDRLLDIDAICEVEQYSEINIKVSTQGKTNHECILHLENVVNEAHKLLKEFNAYKQ